MPSVRVTCRFAGAAYKFLYGHDISGNNWISLASSQEQIECLKQDTAIAVGAVGIGRRRDPNRQGAGEWFQEIQLPLANVGDDGTRVYLRHVDWRPRSDELSLRRSRTSDGFVTEGIRVISILSEQVDDNTSTLAQEQAGAADARRDVLPKFDGQRVVIVDDEAAIRELLALHLENAGLTVISLDSARAVLEGDYDKTAHCIVSDIRMPDIDGLELQEELNRRKARVPFIVVTAHGDIPLAVRIMRAGAVDVLEKPFRPASLLSAVERALALGSELEWGCESSRSRQRFELLSSRGREVFDLLVERKTSRTPAYTLGIS